MTRTVSSGFVSPSLALTPGPRGRGDSVQALLDAAATITAGEPTSSAPPSPGRPASIGDTRWSQDASILLLGIRGTGKTSLALLAASCVSFRLVDADQNFYQATGVSRATYVSQYGFDEYRRHELDLMRSLLRQNPRRCIVVCGPGSTEGTGQQLLKELGNKHPIIHIMRDAEEVAKYLRVNDVAKIRRLSEMASSTYRSASNFEFYNLSESIDDEYRLSSPGPHPSLVLKNVELDFLRLIHSIRGQSTRPRILQARHLLSFIPPESKPFTYALTVPLHTISAIALQLRNTDLVVDAVEIVVDIEQLLPHGKSFDDAAATFLTKEYYALRRNVRLPVMIHVALPDSRWASVSSDAEKQKMMSTYLQIVNHALRLAPDYLTLDLSCEQEDARGIITRKVSTKIIGHFYDPAPAAGAWDSDLRVQLLATAEEWGCDLARVCQFSRLWADNAGVQRFLYRASKSEHSRLPVIAYNVGHAGRRSCYENTILSPVTHSLVREAISKATPSPLAVPQPLLTVQDAQNALYASFELDRLVFGIFGNAVSSTMSPQMHNAAFEFCHMPHTYRVYESSSLSDLVPLVKKPNFGGASISAPFKKDVLSMLQYVSPEAQAIEAVNTLVPLRSQSLGSLVERNKAGPVVALFGDNTDWIGLHTCIRRNLSPVNAANNRKTALILGAGGMAQAAVYAAIRLGVRSIFIHNRTLSKAERIVKQFHGRSFSVHNINILRDSPSSSPHTSGISTPNTQTLDPVSVQTIPSMDLPWPEGFDSPTIIVSCIARVSLNGEPKADNRLPEAWLGSPTGGVTVELAYNPLETPLLQQVRALSNNGWIAVHGLEVLPEQGFAQFELFTGRPAPKHLMKAQITRHLTGSDVGEQDEHHNP